MTKTAAQDTANAKVQYNAFLAVCPSRQLLDRISNKWVVLILCALGGDSSAKPSTTDAGTAMRYSEISRLLVGVSQKMLTQNLRALERDVCSPAPSHRPSRSPSPTSSRSSACRCTT